MCSGARGRRPRRRGAFAMCGQSLGRESAAPGSGLTNSILAMTGANAALIERILDSWESYARALERNAREWREQTAIALRYAATDDLRAIAAIVPVDGRQNGERYARVQALIGGEAIK